MSYLRTLDKGVQELSLAGSAQSLDPWISCDVLVHCSDAELHWISLPLPLKKLNHLIFGGGSVLYAIFVVIHYV